MTTVSELIKCKKHYETILQGLNNSNDDILLIRERIRQCDDQLRIVCDHEYVDDLIDIDPDKSIHICYCVKCELMKK